MNRLPKPANEREEFWWRFDMVVLTVVSIVGAFYNSVNKVTIQDAVTDSIMPILGLSLVGLLLVFFIIGAVYGQTLTYLRRALRIVACVVLVQSGLVFANYLFASDVQVIGAECVESKRFSHNSHLVIILENSMREHSLKLENEQMFCQPGAGKYINLRVREGLLGWLIVQEVYCPQ